MEIILLLIVVSLVLLGLLAWGFLWAVGAGQFEDLEAQGRSILMDDDEPPAPRPALRAQDDDGPRADHGPQTDARDGQGPAAATTGWPSR